MKYITSKVDENKELRKENVMLKGENRALTHKT